MPNKTRFLNSTALMRLKREDELERLERLSAECSAMQKGINISDSFSGTSFGLALLSVATVFPVVGAVLGGVLIGSAVAKRLLGNTMVEKGCSDIPMKQLEAKLNRKIHEINRKLDQQTEVLKDISEKVSETLSEVEDMRKEMKEGFLLTITFMKELDASHPISVIKTAAASVSFSDNNKVQANREQYTNIMIQEIAEGFFYSYIKPQGALYEALFSIINRNNAKPESINDQNAYNALSALSFGTLTYVSIFLSLIDQYTYVAEYSYEARDLDKFNENLDRLLFYFPYFQVIINKNSEGLIDKVIGILKYAKDKHNLVNLNYDLYQSFQRQIDTLLQFKKNVTEMTLPVLTVTPVNDIDINFSSYTDGQRSTTDFLDWKKGSKVSYALQYEKDGKFSKVSSWVSQEVMNLANPKIELRTMHETNRLIFRKFGNNPPELIRIVSGQSLSFRDIDRDLYNLVFKKSYDDEEILDRMLTLIRFGANMKAEFENERNVMHAAAEVGRVVLLPKIIDHSDESIVNKKDSFGLTPLHLAAQNNKAEFLKELIEQNADVNAKTDQFNLTPLHVAVRYQCEKCVDYLLSSKGIRPNDSDKGGKTPLHIAVSDNSLSPKIVEKLANDPKVDVNAKDSLGLTPLHTAVLLNSTKNFFNLKPRKDLDLWATDNNNMTALHYAAMNGFIGPLSGITITDTKGLNEAVTDRDWTPLHFAAYFKHEEIVSLLVRSLETKDKIKTDLPDADLQTPLHLAAASGAQDAVRNLIFPGQAKVYKKTAQCYTPLDLALLNRQEETVKEILTWEREFTQQMENGSYVADLDPLACGIASTKNILWEYLVERERCERRKAYPWRSAGDCGKKEKRSPREEEEKDGHFYFQNFSKENDYQTKAKISNDSFKSNEELGIKKYNVFENADVNGALLLLDLFMRKYRNEKFTPELQNLSSPFDERVQALKMTEKLEKVLSAISSEKNMEDLDFLDVHSKLYKAITSRDGRRIVNILCSFIEEYSSLTPDEVQQVLTEVTFDEPETIFPEKQANLKRFIEQSCYNNKRFLTELTDFYTATTMSIKINFQNSSALMRMKREDEMAELERLSAWCNKLQKGSNAADAATSAAFGVGMLTLATALPGVGALLGGVLIGAGIGKRMMGDAMVDKNCSDLPMRKMEVRMNRKIHDINRKLDQQTEILKDISDKVSKTLSDIQDMRKEMSEGFLLTIKTMKELDTSHPISVIKTVSASIAFSENNKLQASKQQYTNVMKQEIAEGFFYSYIKPQGTLYEALFSIINRNTAKPESIDDQNAYNALSALTFGTLTYVSIFLSLIDQYTYVAEYCYQKNDLENFNEHLDRLLFYFPFFDVIINKSNEGLIDKVVEILSYAKDNHGVGWISVELYDTIQSQINTLQQFKKNITSMSLPVIKDPPVNDIDINFDAYDVFQRSTTDFLDWKKGSKISYALQYEKDGKYSKVSNWVSEEVMSVANPKIELRNTDEMNRLVFRKFDNNPPELIRIVSGDSLSFRDVDRDLYNLVFKRSYNDEEMVDRMFQLIRFGADLKAEFENKRNVMHAAAEAGRVVLLTKIIDYSEESLVNKKDAFGLTPLHVAAENNKAEFVKALIEQNADVNAKTDDFNSTPLHLAVRWKCEKCVEYLLSSKDIRPNDSDSGGKTPLHIAVSDNSLNPKVVDRLVKDPNVDVNAKDKLGLTPLHSAVLLNSKKNFFNLASRKNLDLWAKDNNNMTALHYAAMSGFSGPLSGIIQTDTKGINEAATSREWTPLHFAAYFKHEEVIHLLLHSKETKDTIQADLPDADLQTPLHLAAAGGVKEAVKYLISPGQAKVYKKTAKGYTALDLALLYKHEESVREILTWERDLNQQMENGSYIADLDPLACGIAQTIFMWDLWDYLVELGRCKNNKLYPLPKKEKRSFISIRENVGNNEHFYFQNFSKENDYQPKAKISSDSFKSNEDLGIKKYNIFLNANVNGALLLLDLFMRKYRNEKFTPELQNLPSPFDERVQALKITEKLEKVLSAVSSEKNMEDLDFFDVHSKLYKAITSRDGRRIVNTLCSFIEEYSSLTPEEVQQVLTEVTFDEPETIFPEKQADANLKRLIEQSCYNNKRY
ncbi:uncharacterized protein [Parasteatoda tepidariorum]|uniref:uncharacterized protein n=1 Tax=Parasteatoda tepidariorum TaxID=114398 RepID=UPI001C71B8BD|nr:delta-latroinsectotoxin-Lt1a [Parasteatoda tepidariorum]